MTTFKPGPVETINRTRPDGTTYATYRVRWTHPLTGARSSYSKLVDCDDADDFRSWLRGQGGRVTSDAAALADGTWRGGTSTTAGTVAGHRLTFKGYAFDQIDKRTEAVSKTKTKEKRTLELFVPTWLDRPIRSITTDDTDAFIRSLDEPITRAVGSSKTKTTTKPLASSSVIRYQWVVYGIFEAAVRDNVLTKNPFREEPPPVGKARRRLPDDAVNLSKENYGKLVHAAALVDRQTEELLRLLLASGLRIGEALALQVRHVDVFDGGTTIRVRQALVREEDGSTIVSTPKAAKRHVVSTSERNVEIPAAVADDLRRYFEELGITKDDANRFAFASPKSIRGGKPWAYASWVKGRWSRVIALAELPFVKGQQPTPHCLRHTYACRMINAGVPMFEVSKLLGHASTRITEERYAHLCELEAQKRARETAATILPDRRVPAETLSNGWFVGADGRKVRRTRDGRIAPATPRDERTKSFAKKSA